VKQSDDAWTVDPSRSRLMARVRSKDTKPELIVRSVAHRMGYRFRLHRRDLPGTPDLVFVRHRKVIFVHGCFWHRHRGCYKCTAPKTRPHFWQDKFDQNVQRDIRSVLALEALGWDVLTVWECQTADVRTLAESLSRFLSLDAADGGVLNHPPSSAP